MKVALFILAEPAPSLAQRLKQGLQAAGFAEIEVHGPVHAGTSDVEYVGAAEHLRRLYAAGQAIVGICASGILIRALAPLIADKSTEPPVVAVAEDGSCAVPLLGGHHGANDLARQIAQISGGVAALTTAGDLRFGVSLDQPPPGYWLRNPQQVKRFASALLRGEPVQIRGSASWLSALPQSATSRKTILITEQVSDGDEDTLVYHPETLAVGIGCERGTDPDELRKLINDTLSKHGLSEKSVACLATIDLKEDEPAVVRLGGRPIRFFTTEELRPFSALVPNPSDTVAAEVGTPSVAEAAALAAAGEGSRLIVPKSKSRRATCAIARAPSPIRNLPGRKAGKLTVVGIGPGDKASRTAASVSALRLAEDWVGYGLYLDLVDDLRDSQVQHRFPLGAEEERVRHAISLAKSGRAVALVSSGDASIYAMGSLVFELLEQQPCKIAVEVLPGVSAFQAASARAGAIIGHDFCCISLSDLLTPWDVIRNRVLAAAAGDFVVSFYNPRSEKRRDHLQRAIAILADHRPPHTPVVVAANLGRGDERVTIVPLVDFDAMSADMLTLVTVGSSQSRMFVRRGYEPRAYTPRGYANKRAAS
jgi:cobalt-precorrin 5A hydrolase/precorrin-3B C17-methyltransferase